MQYSYHYFNVVINKLLSSRLIIRLIILYLTNIFTCDLNFFRKYTHHEWNHLWTNTKILNIRLKMFGQT